jgi:hypothetical protein
MPQVAWWNGPGQLDEAAAAYIEGEYLIMGYHKMNLTWAEDRAVLAHEMAHHIDYMIKQTEEAAWLYRNSRTTGGKLKAVKIKGKVAYYVMKGPWGDEYQGRKYGLINSKINVKPGHGEDYGGTYKEATEINSMGREFADSDLDLAKQYCKKTEVVSFMLSVLRGMFMPL